MVKKYTCSFCGTDIEPGTGTLYVRNDGTILYLCSRKCRRNQLELKRRARRLKWTEVYEERTRRRAQKARTKKVKEKAKPKAKAKPAAKPKAKAKPAAKPKAKAKPAAKPKAKGKAATSKNKG